MNETQILKYYAKSNKICPVCGKPVKTTYQRIVGFLTPCSTYSKERKEEFGMRTWFEGNDEGTISNRF